MECLRYGWTFILSIYRDADLVQDIQDRVDARLEMARSLSEAEESASKAAYGLVVPPLKRRRPVYTDKEGPATTATTDSTEARFHQLKL
jgi:hypothetical protein